MSASQISFIFYGLFMLVGGVIGYKKAGSKISLVMGVISSLLIFFGVWLMQGTAARMGQFILLGTSLFLTAVFFQRSAKTRKFMPSGILCLISLAAVLLLLFTMVP